MRTRICDDRTDAALASCRDCQNGGCLINLNENPAEADSGIVQVCEGETLGSTHMHGAALCLYGLGRVRRGTAQASKWAWPGRASARLG